MDTGRTQTGGLIPKRQSICYTRSVPCLRLLKQARSRAGSLTEHHDFNRRPVLSQRVHSYIAADPGGLISGVLLRERVFLSSLEVVLCFEGIQ